MSGIIGKNFDVCDQPFQKEKGDHVQGNMDVYFSADVETDGPSPGPYSLLSFALVYAGRFNGEIFERFGELRSHILRK